jgi:hypothetical protein
VRHDPLRLVGEREQQDRVGARGGREVRRMAVDLWQIVDGTWNAYNG